VADVKFSSAIPVLPSIDIEASLNFYRSKLGFSLAFQYPEYGGVEAGSIQIHFCHCEDPELPKVTSCRVNVVGVDALYQEAIRRGVVHPNGSIEDKPWGFREFTVIDCCGNAIIFAEPLKSAT
jgi:catechol 2,3-dioxygenase-like lactoylglutathione lyase family enzyme